MKAVVVIEGERDWQNFLPGIQIHRRRLEGSRWLVRDGRLWIVDRKGITQADGVLWRANSPRPQPRHRAVLEMIRYAGIPCVNSAKTLLHHYDRLAMRNALLEAELPLMPCAAALGEFALDMLEPSFPSVVKVGSYHEGLGKMRMRDGAEWEDARDLLYITEEYVTVEPYMNYKQDVRCLAVGEEIWAITRQRNSWKTSSGTSLGRAIEVPPQVRDYTMRAMQHLGADYLGVEFLCTRDGSCWMLEANHTPDLREFPRDARVALSKKIQHKLQDSAA